MSEIVEISTNSSRYWPALLAWVVPWVYKTCSTNVILKPLMHIHQSFVIRLFLTVLIHWLESCILSDTEKKKKKYPVSYHFHSSFLLYWFEHLLNFQSNINTKHFLDFLKFPNLSGITTPNSRELFLYNSSSILSNFFFNLKS